MLDKLNINLHTCLILPQLLVVELSPQLMEAAVDTCAQTILDIQSENLLNTFPEKTKEELLQFIKVSYLSCSETTQEM